MNPLKIAFVSSEVVPFAKTGGLADVAGALGKYLSNAGHDTRVFMPYYHDIDFSKMEVHVVDYLQNIPLEFNGTAVEFTVLTTTIPGSGCDIYFIHCPGLYNRSSIYTDDDDEYLRFAVLSRAAIECCQRMGWAPDIFHCNDWQSALIPLFLKTLYNWDTLFSGTKTILTIHNIGYQGMFSADVIKALNLEAHRQMLPQEDLDSGVFNYLKTGIIYADVITTVSNTYAHEIQTEAYGAGLQDLLYHHRGKLAGIVNGVDYQEWSPENDRLIPFRFSPEDLSGKEQNKKALLEKMGLSYVENVPVFGIVSRLTAQKGFDLLAEILFDVLAKYELRFVVLGSGEQKYAQLFEKAQYHFPDKFCFYNGYNNALSHLIEAGSDIFVMPSRYEPCGLNQIYSLKYGTVPIVRKTGGLADTVQLYNWEDQTGTGFVFDDYSAAGLSWAIEFAYSTYQHRDAWQKLMRNGMAADFSWERQVQLYIDLYRRILLN